MPLNVSQKLFNRDGEISEINVGVLNGNMIDKISNQIMEAIPNAKAIPIIASRRNKNAGCSANSEFLATVGIDNSCCWHRWHNEHNAGFS